MSALPTTSNNSYTGTWSPAVNNIATTTYTFTPTADLCATTATMTITVNPNVTPTFTQVSAICSGATLSALPTTSNNSIIGTWSPALSNSATTEYTFTPTAGQCATTATMTITVNSIVTPSFTQVAAICSGASLSALPTTSNNSIIGTWSPSLSNSATTEYTFTPTPGQCATTATMTITVNSIITPSFTQVGPICSGATVSALPTTSNNSITGTWSPSLNNTANTIYTFTPTAGLCASTTTMTITVSPNVTPMFTQIAAICSGVNLNALPTTSNNLVNGSWLPALNNTATTTYTFTPTAGQCAATATMTITVNPVLNPSVAITSSSSSPICPGTSITFTATPTNGGATPSYQWKLNGTNIAGANSVTYTTTTLNNGQIITVAMTVAEACATPPTALSNGITTTVNTPIGITAITPASSATTTTTTITATGVVGTGVVVSWYNATNPGVSIGTGVTSPSVGPGTYNAVVTGTCGSTIQLATTISSIYGWTGATNKRWDNASNWSPAVVPTNQTAVVINGSFTNQPEVPGNNTVSYAKSITLQDNAVLTIKTNGGLQVTNEITVASTAQFIVEDKANLSQINPNAVNTGNIKVRKSTRGIQRLDYVLWSSPTHGDQTLKQFSPQTVDNRFYTYNSATNVYSVVTNILTPFETGKGYLIRTPNNHATTSSAWDVEYQGVPNNGTITQQMPAPRAGEQNRYFAVGNPYASAINIQSFIDANQANIVGGIYIWRKTNGSGNSGYASVHRNTEGILQFTSNGNGGAENPEGCIPSGQGFIVEMEVGASQVVFNNTMRVCNGFGPFNRTAQATNSTVTSDQFTVKLARDNGEFTFANVGYYANASNSYEASYDVQSMSDALLSVSSLLDDKRIVSQARAAFTPSDVVPLSLITNAAGNYQLSLDSIEGLFVSNQTVYLRDNTMGTIHNLADGPYSFVSAVGTFASRFEIIYQSSSLGVTTPVFNENQVVIYKTRSSELSINTGSVVMSSVKIFDITGKLLLEKKGIDASQTLLTLGTATEILLVQITSSEGTVVTKKVLFPRTSLKLDKKIDVKTQLAEDE